MALYYQSAIRNLPEDYTFRGAMLSDIPIVAFLFKQSQNSNTRIDNYFLEELRNNWKWPGFNPALDIRLIFDPREHLIGYIEVWKSTTPTCQSWLWGCVHPDYQGQGIGTSLLGWAEARLRVELQNLPSHSQISPQFFALRNQTTVHSLCKNLGWLQVQEPNELPKQVYTYRNVMEKNHSEDVDVYSSYAVYKKVILTGNSKI